MSRKELTLRMRLTFAIVCALWAVSLPAEFAPVGQLASLQERGAARYPVTEINAQSVVNGAPTSVRVVVEFHFAPS
jgi:hypothetical protein